MKEQQKNTVSKNIVSIISLVWGEIKPIFFLERNDNIFINKNTEL